MDSKSFGRRVIGALVAFIYYTVILSISAQLGGLSHKPVLCLVLLLSSIPAGYLANQLLTPALAGAVAVPTTLALFSVGIELTDTRGAYAKSFWYHVFADTGQDLRFWAIAILCVAAGTVFGIQLKRRTPVERGAGRTPRGG